MEFKTLKTDRRLWSRIAFVLFLLPWFVPLVYVQGSPLPPAIFLLGLVMAPQECLGIVIKCGLSFGVAAASVGWLVQCIAVTMRGRPQ
jgi:hypothetical protein